MGLVVWFLLVTGRLSPARKEKMMKKKKKQKQIREQTWKIRIFILICCLYVFLCVYRSPGSHHRRGKGWKRLIGAPPWFALSPVSAREITRRQRRWRVGRRDTQPPCTAATVPALFQKYFLYFSFGLCVYLNFYCILNYYL